MVWGDRTRVVHLDDHASYVDLPAGRLEAQHGGVSVLIARTIDEACSLLATEPVDCLLGPVTLGGDRVVEQVIDRAHAVDPTLPVVLFDDCEPAAVADLLEPGTVTFVRRPATPDDAAYSVLATRVRSIVDDRDERSLFDPLADPLEDLFDERDEPVCVLRDGAVTTANAAFETWFGTTSISRTAIAERAVADGPTLAASLEPPTTERLTLPLELADGTQRRVTVTTASDGDAVLACWRDERGGDEPSRAETMLHSLLENMPIAIYFKDEQSRHVRVSDALVGMAAEDYVVNPEGKRHHATADVLGKTDFDLYKTNHAAPAVEDDRKIVETGTPIEGREEYTVADDGEDVWLLTTKARWEDADGEPLGVVGMTIDITEQKLSQQADPVPDQRLEQFEEIIARTLRAAVADARRSLERGIETGDDDQYRAATDHLAETEAVLERMLELARDSQSPTRLSSIDLADLVERVWSDREEDLLADARLRATVDRIVLADTRRLERLLKHAFRIVDAHTTAGVIVEVGALEDGFYVEHDGAALTPAERDQLLAGRYTDSGTGAGLAMTTVVGLANAHGWETDVSNDGTRIAFTGVELG